MTKGDLMKIVYSEEELRYIDSAIPMEYWKTLETYYHVVNYNNKGLGVLEDMRIVAKERFIIINRMASVCVIDSSVLGLFLYSVDEKWDSETIEAYLHSQGRKLTNCHWGIYDEIVDLKEY